MEILHYAIPCMAFVLFILLHLFRSGTGSKKLPPSPAALPIIGHLHLLKPPRYLSVAALAARYGPVISLHLGSRQALIISSPSAVEEVLVHKDPIFANHPMVHSSILACGETSMFFAPYGPHWRNLRRITIAELLSTSRLNQLAAIRKEEILCVVRSMLRGASGGGLGEVQLEAQMFGMACNAMLKMVVGKRYYGEEVPERDVEVAKQFREIHAEGVELIFAFNPRDFFPALGWMDLMGVERRIEKQRVKMDRFLAKLLEEQRRKRRMEREEASREENAADAKRTLINAMLSLQENEPEAYSDDLIKSHIMVLFNSIYIFKLRLDLWV